MIQQLHLLLAVNVPEDETQEPCLAYVKSVMQQFDNKHGLGTITIKE